MTIAALKNLLICFPSAAFKDEEKVFQAPEDSGSLIEDIPIRSVTPSDSAISERNGDDELLEAPKGSDDVAVASAVVMAITSDEMQVVELVSSGNVDATTIGTSENDAHALGNVGANEVPIISVIAAEETPQVQGLAVETITDSIAMDSVRAADAESGEVVDAHSLAPVEQSPSGNESQSAATQPEGDDATKQSIVFELPSAPQAAAELSADANKLPEKLYAGVGLFSRRSHYHAQKKCQTGLRRVTAAKVAGLQPCPKCVLKSGKADVKVEKVEGKVDNVQLKAKVKAAA
mmetsp:Transcript_7178/g.12243  ORF Transcript_7178/g.12243 Transcript_7178/m.12243 type:complete len:291 (-) Transcript_7178:253-1125(-)|eukprot:CAMPEP_0196656616 /NCGR_PEP_ID=MMETSP1086-20130531/18891_1 /TAXON_ID=77921 /ORGANISM="Cyanoptyche  gloeocystis , Strain SAG4.97" /LENGTH=290 /DNA_ID=CAMNT_0041989447 /DNA_START=66 /DNA_END=938 /DNA_ORIENTATION=-